VASIFEVQRDVGALVLPRTGRVVRSEGVVPWLVVDAGGTVIEPISRFLRDFVAQGNRVGSVRSYAYVLHRWWRFLAAVEGCWDRATAAETRDLVLWMMHTSKPDSARRRADARRVGVNPVTRKRYLDDGYQPRTIRHNNAVLRSFYEYWIERGEGPLINPVPRDRIRGGRPNAHHNPLEPFRPEGRLRYNPAVPGRAPRAMPDECWDDLFGSLRSNRDRALLALAISTAARASELLGIGDGDVDWGQQLVRVRRKGTDAEQWLPASPEAFVWLRLYLSEFTPRPQGSKLWWTLRRRGDGGQALVYRPLTCDALRAVLRRANDLLGANWTMHDLRHTCALRMLRDEGLSLRDVQTILGHAHLSTTEIYLEEDDLEVIRRVRQHLNTRRSADTATPPLVADGYDLTDLDVLLGGGLR
jgi:integrase/recombinase XerD